MEELLTGESSSIEYKQEVPSNSEKYLKTIIAFANGNGGQMVFGIEDKTCQVVGIPQDQVFMTADRITNAIADACQPVILKLNIKLLKKRRLLSSRCFRGQDDPIILNQRA
ncbi:hypothetical protein GH808_09315 [Acetobacterium fimetarium]|uniref:Schlafen AlbA-2 domain-containing protein n=1 Tax=Acetobacterium fimetarium TaxID=52691 RepID=A0ABR6WW24_9FIRM|nr:ATP-binding protein [Acetobacterium fimetarium]MBC3804628.1 hypothetical protein [Acetobacterium fimetarium]